MQFRRDSGMLGVRRDSPSEPWITFEQQAAEVYRREQTVFMKPISLPRPGKIRLGPAAGILIEYGQFPLCAERAEIEQRVFVANGP